MKTWDDFFDIVRLSGLLNQESFARACCAAEGLTEPTIIARRLVQEKVITRWQSRQLLAGNHALLIGNYRLLDLLSTDPAVPVYLAEHAQMQRFVEMKALTRGAAAALDRKDDILAQVRALAALEHANLCHVYDLVCEDVFYYLVVEHASLRRVRDIVAAQGPFSCEVAAGLVSSAAAALQYAHQHGVLHLGIRPDRLAIDSQGNLKVLDIGIPQLTRRKAASTLPGANDGIDEADYLAPEQLTGHEVDGRADIYALGCVFYFLLTGKPPFHAGSELQKSAPETSLVIRASRTDVPSELADICRRMTSVRAEDRYASANEVVKEIAAWHQRSQSTSAAATARAAPPKSTIASAAAAPATVRPAVFEASPTRPREWWRLSRMNAAIVGGAAVFVLFVVTSAILISGDSTQIRPPATPLVTSTPIPSVTTLATLQDSAGREDENSPNKSRTPDVPKPPSTNLPPVIVGKPAVMQSPTVAAAQEKPKPVPPRTEPAPSTPIKFHPLEILSISGPPGVTFHRQQDGSVLVTAINAKAAVYTIAAKTQLQHIRGFRLEAMADGRLSKNGPGASSNGNFVLSNFSVAMAARADEPKFAPVELSAAAADFSQEQYPVTAAIDANPSSGWAVYPQIGQGHWASFATKQPIGHSGGTWLTIKMEQPLGDAHFIGRFRITAITGEKPGEDPAAAIRVVDRALKPYSELMPSVALPALPTDANGAPEPATPLSKIFLDPAWTLDVSLIEAVAKADDRRTFNMQPAPTAESPHRWTIQYSVKGVETATVAEVQLVRDDLTFGWTPKAAGLPAANLLRNCVLDIVAGGRKRGIALRAPLQVNALPLGCGGAIDRPVQKIPIPWLPSSAQINIELSPSSISLPGHTISGNYLAVDKEAVLTFAQSNQPTTQVAVQSKLIPGQQATLEGNLRIKTGAYWASPGGMQPLNRPGMEQLLQKAAAQKTAIQAALDNLNRYNAKLPASRKLEKDQVARQIKEAQQRLGQTAVAVGQLTSLVTRASAIDAAGPLPFRVLMTVGDHSMVLVEGTGKP